MAHGSWLASNHAKNRYATDASSRAARTRDIHWKGLRHLGFNRSWLNFMANQAMAWFPAYSLDIVIPSSPLASLAQAGFDLVNISERIRFSTVSDRQKPLLLSNCKYIRVETT
jgi:hypothetical protein